MTDMIISDTNVFARAELDVQITTAKAYPRNTSKAVAEAVEMATMDEKTAESCFYCMVRNGQAGKSEIKGPSIRLAEIVASSWGNMHAASRIVENDGKFITAEGVAWDLEKNVKISAQVKRRITDRKGHTFSDDMQGVTGNAACSIALRNAILKVIPKALVDRVYDMAVKTAVGDQKSLASKRAAVFSRFNKLGIETGKILSFFGKSSIEDFGVEDVADLIGIGTSIKEGILSIDKAFCADADETSLSEPEDKIKFLIDTKDS